MSVQPCLVYSFEVNGVQHACHALSLLNTARTACQQPVWDLVGGSSGSANAVMTVRQQTG